MSLSPSNIKINQIIKSHSKRIIDSHKDKAKSRVRNRLAYSTNLTKQHLRTITNDDKESLQDYLEVKNKELSTLKVQAKHLQQLQQGKVHFFRVDSSVDLSQNDNIISVEQLLPISKPNQLQAEIRNH